MEPLSRVAFEYPIYGMDILSDGSVAVAGGGGRMKSGIPNACEVLTYNARTRALHRAASTSLADAPIALAATRCTLVTVVTTGCKNFEYKPPHTLSPTSAFAHDLQVSSTAEQSAIAISADSSRLAVASDEGHLTVVALPDYTPFFSKPLHTQGVTDLALSPDGLRLASAARDRHAYILDAASAHIVQQLPPALPAAMRTHVRAIRFNAHDPALIFTAESNPRKGGWISARRASDPITGPWEVVATVKAFHDALTAFAVNEEGSIAAASSAEGHVAVFRWNGASFARAWTTEPAWRIGKPRAPPHVLPVTAMRFAGGGNELFTASADYTVAVWPTRRPANWRIWRRVAFWVLTAVVAVLAVLLAEDKHLNEGLVRRRSVVQPYLEPHLSQLQQQARPVLRRRTEELQPYLVELQTAAEPHIRYAREKADPVLERVEQYRQKWLPVLNEGREQASQIVQASSVKTMETLRLGMGKLRYATGAAVAAVQEMRKSAEQPAEKVANPASQESSRDRMSDNEGSAVGTKQDGKFKEETGEAEDSAGSLDTVHESWSDSDDDGGSKELGMRQDPDDSDIDNSVVSESIEVSGSTKRDHAKRAEVPRGSNNFALTLYPGGRCPA